MKLSKSRDPRGVFYCQDLRLFKPIMEMTGIEPVTCGLQSHRSPN